MLEVAFFVLSLALAGTILACLKARAELDAMRYERDQLARDLKAFHRLHAKGVDGRRKVW